MKYQKNNFISKFAVFIKKHVISKESGRRWNDLLALFASLISLSSFCLGNTIDGLLRVIVTVAVTVWFLYISGKAVYHIWYFGKERGWSFADMIKDTATHIRALSWKQRILYTVVVIGVVGGIGFFCGQYHTTDYYTSVTEIYGIPTGGGRTAVLS